MLTIVDCKRKPGSAEPTKRRTSDVIFQISDVKNQKTHQYSVTVTNELSIFFFERDQGRKL